MRKSLDILMGVLRKKLNESISRREEESQTKKVVKVLLKYVPFQCPC